MNSNNIFRLDGKIVLVTGGCGGIGLGISKAMAQAGARVIVVDCSDRMDAAVDELRKLDSGCDGFRYDLMNIDGLENMCAQIEEKFGPLDILVNNAGINIRARADEMNYGDWRRVMALNLDVPFVLSSAWARRRIEAGQTGSVVMLASLTSEQARPSISAYASSKGGVRQLIKSLAVDWATFGIRVNGVAPGYIATEMNRALVDDQDVSAWVLDSTPLRRWGRPDDIGPVAVFLASDAAAFITGEMVFVDGGWMAAL